jgi:hypothetical protein
MVVNLLFNNQLKYYTMPYLIETFSKSLDGSKLVLRNVDQFNCYDSKEAAQAAIELLYAEQVANNNELMQDYYNRLEAQTMDIDTEDRILRAPKPYAYTYKAAKYSNRAVKRLA